ncbi:hemagglutinin repeat-containing protein [Glaesserella parasuis]|nr:hemagglutinin repeat-containing protein [Glaesserella parasuis]
MNKHCFRVIFSKTLQCLVVTSELAKSAGKATEKSSFSLSQIFAQIRPLTFSLYCALGFVAFSDSALANLIIQADKSALKNQQPIVLQTANGLPQVNIQTPNDKGLSHNKYSKFDVDTKGAILNNSRMNVQTQQGGWVQGNPYLARGEAKVILNEVNSSDPSILKGYVEVAGKKADVIIANPSGLHCEGCGIINSDRATFTTGKPQIKNGHLDSLVVEKGKVKVSGKGLDNSRVDYTEVIARETEVNAGIWSKKEAKVVTGKNTVKRSDSLNDLQIIHTNQPPATESQPKFAIDVGELGGMYSGKIHLIGTEHGVGVRNAGHIGASADTLHIDSQGRIVNKGTLNAHHAVQLTGSKGIENRGKIENRQGNITLNTASDIQQDGSIVARSGHIHKTANQAINQQGETVAKGHITYKAPTVTASISSLIASGVEVKDSAQGEVRTLEPQSAQGKSITVTSTGKATLQGKNVASGNINVSGSQADLDHSQTSAHAINVNASQGKIQANNATLIAHTELAFTTPTSLETQHSDVKAEKITTKQRSLNTKGATWEQTGEGELKLDVADTLHNSGGIFKTQGDLTVNAQGVDNQQGRLIAKGKLTVNTEHGKLDSTQGLLAAEQDIAINSGELMNDGGLIQSSQNVTINTQGKNLSNQQTFMDSQDKGIVALGQLDIQSSHFSNQQGRVVSGKSQNLRTEDLNNQQGFIYTQQDLTLNSTNLTNDKGKVSAATKADLTLSGHVVQRNGVIETQKLNLTAKILNSTDQSLIFADSLNMTTSGELNNLDSRIITKLDGSIQTGDTLNNTNGTLGSQQGSFTINTHHHRLVNEKGSIVALQNMTVESGAIDNKQGLISANNITLNSHNQAINNQDTFSTARDKGIVAQSALTIATGLLNNTKGNILSHDRSTIYSTSLVNHHGEIRAQSQLDLNADTLTQNAGLVTANIVNLVSRAIQSNQQSEISGSLINVTAQTLDNSESKLIARQTAHIDAQHGIQNQNGTLVTLGDTLFIRANQSSVDNKGGVISAQNGTLQLEASVLDNQQGAVRAHTANITRLQRVDNRNTQTNDTQGIIVTDLNLNTQQIHNQAGRIAAFNQATLNSTDIQNQSGEILVAKDGVLNAENIQNQAGKIASIAANLSITTKTILNNQLGTLSAADQLVLHTKGLHNQQGSISSSNQLEINTAEQVLNNQEGSIFANTQAKIESGEINNQRGLIRADGELSIDTHKNAIDNRNTQGKEQGIVGLGNVVLKHVDNLFNQQGKLYAENALNIGVQAHTNNSQGIMQSNGTFTLSTQELDNQAGNIFAKYKGDVTAEHINNNAVSEKGSLISAESLTLHTQQLDNQGTKAKGKVPTQGIQGNNITIQTTNMNNQQGGIYSTDNVSITAHDRLDNQKGELLAVNKINVLHRGNLMVNNEQGLIQGNNAVDLNAKGLESEGNIKTEGNLTITLKDSFTLNNAFEASNLVFTTKGDFTNNIAQSIANNMQISANHIVNNLNAELSANETTLNTNSLTNRGLIDGNKTLINSTKVTNIGTGRIYGDHLSFRANTIENLAETLNNETKAGTIAARERLDFGVDKLTNRDHALILSLGDMAIGGDLDAQGYAIGQAGFVDNGSATIEVLGGADINTIRLLNHDLYLKTGIRTNKAYFKEYTPEASSDIYFGSGGENSQGWLDWNNNNRHDRNAYFRFNNGTSVGSPTWFQKFYTRTTNTTTLEYQDPAKILIGGTLSFLGEKLTNDSSQLLIGQKLRLGDQLFDRNIDNSNLTTVDTHLENIDLLGEIYRLDQGETSTLVSKRKRRGRKKVWAHYTENINYNFNRTLPIETFGFQLVLNTIGTLISSTATLDSKPQAKDVQLDTVSVTTSNVEQLGKITVPQTQLGGKTFTEITFTPEINRDEVVNSGQVIAKLHQVVEGDTVPDLTNLTMPMVKTHLADVRLPEASLYKINPDAPNGYLVETDPKFTDRKQWLSSDYMFEQLRYNHDNVHKRLGDGFYEQRLINEQINQLTGRRYIEGYNNDLAQYQALMNSGVQYAKQFNLAVGVGLTAKQMSELTTDMVWLVNKEITLADGRKITALVPQVYLVARNSDISSRGAVISANQIVGNVDELNNSGVIAGRDLTLIHSNQLEHQGTILGETVDLSAQQNLINLGGRIEAVKSLSLSAGKNLEISSTLSSAESADGNFAHTVLDRLASVKVNGEGGQLNLQSAGDLTVKAAQLDSQGRLNANAGNALHITTLTTQNKEHYNGDADNYYRLDQKAEAGSTLTGKEGISLVANHDVTLRQAEVGSEAGKVLIGSKTGDIVVEAGRAEEQLATSVKSTSSGLLSKTTTVSRHFHETTNAVASHVDGQAVSLIAQQGNISVKGSNVVAEQDLTLAAKENVSIVSDVNTHYQEDYSKTTKSGLMGSGGIGFTIGSKKETTEQDRTQESAASSQVGSLKGNTTIQADNHYQQIGSLVTAVNGDVDIFAKSADIIAARSDYESNYKYTMEQKGVTIALTGAVAAAIQAVDSTVKSAKSVGSSKNDRVNAMAAANVGFEALRAAEQLQGVADAVSNGSATGGAVGVSITYGQQKTEQTQHSEGNTAEKSQVNAGGNVTITAQGKGEQSHLTIEGADVSGQGGTHLKADGDVNILAADENHLERSKNKSSGFNVGVAIQIGGGLSAGITAGGNVAKGYGNGESQAWVASQMGSENSKTTIESGKDTNVIGSQVKGKRVEVSAENLNIESLQDTARYEGKQESIQGQVTVGYGFSADGSYSKSKVNSNYASVKTQAGIYAGDKGYDVDVRKHTELTGGLITSTNKAETEGKNRFSTGTLNATDIENHADYKGSGISVSGSAAVNFDTPLGNSENGIAQSNKQAVNDKGEKIYLDHNDKETLEAKTNGKANKAKPESGLDSLTGNISFGFGSDKDSQHSQTKSGINTTNIEIRDEQAQISKTGKSVENILEEVKTNITTENAEKYSGKLENRFDKDKVLKEIQLQVDVTKRFIDNAQETKDKVIDYYQEPKRKELREAITDYHNANMEDKEQYKAKIDELIQDIYALEHIRTGLDLATGLVAGAPKVMSATTLISVLDTESRRASLNNSLLAPPVEDINDNGKLYSNVGHNSGAFDGIKLGGVRMNYGIICGENNSRCETDEQGKLKLNEKGHVLYRGDKSQNYPTVVKLLKDRDVSGKLFGATGGFQAIEGEMFGIKYKPGSFLDKLTETYAGQHDLVGGQWLFYDEIGNGKRGLTETQEFWIDRYSEAAVLGVTPSTVPHALPLEIRFLLFGVR